MDNTGNTSGGANKKRRVESSRGLFEGLLKIFVINGSEMRNAPYCVPSLLLGNMRAGDACGDPSRRFSNGKSISLFAASPPACYHSR